MPDKPKHYTCKKIKSPLNIDGFISDPLWQEAEWSDYFVDITGDPAKDPYFKTRVKMLWDDSFFYVAAELEEPHVWGTITKQNERRRTYIEAWFSRTCCYHFMHQYFQP